MPVTRVTSGEVLAIAFELHPFHMDPRIVQSCSRDFEATSRRVGGSVTLSAFLRTAMLQTSVAQSE